jgi:ATP-binding cassette, subfamily G (WHITE), member 2
MGPSGCGKTTLLDILAGRKTVGRLEGELLYGGVSPSRTFLRRYTGYVEQFDTLVDTLTVEEMLMYTAELKLPPTVTREEKQRRVDQLIERLGLGVCRNTRIGSPLQRGISGGQAKRVNIGIALITEPRVLFLDEPTTGLDSFTSHEIVKVVRDVSEAGVTVCATIHSPTEGSFKLFDMLILMLQGKIVYLGHAGHLAVDFFASSKLAFREFVPGEDKYAEW